MDPFNQVFHIWPKAITFGFHTAEDIKKVSVVKVVNDAPFNRLNHPNTGGVYDPLMGPMDNRGENCASCQLSYDHCSGHYGHIELCLPVFHPLFQRELVKILKFSCPACKTFLLPDEAKVVLAGQLDLLSCGLLVESQFIRSLDKSFDDILEDDPECEAYLKSKKGTSVDPNLIANVEAKVKEFKEAAGISADFRPRISSRNTEAARLALVKEFAQRITRIKRCPKCKGAWKKLIFYESRIVFSLKTGTVATAVGGTMMGSMEMPLDEFDVTVMDSQENGGAIPKKVKKPKDQGVKHTTYNFNAKDAMEHMQKLWQNDKVMFGYLYPALKAIKCEHPTDVFFINVVPVVPPKFRPISRDSGGIRENARSVGLNNILKQSRICHAIAKYGGNPEGVDSASRDLILSVYGKTHHEKLQNAWQLLQKEVGVFVGTEVTKNNMVGGFKKQMEKKEGLFRMHMMGKRVDYAARSVITPDPNIGVDEVGIPELFAKKLTFPTPVSDYNYQEMARLVRNGPDVHPGAISIVVNGRVMKLPKDQTQRESIASTLISPEVAFAKNSNRNSEKGDGLPRPKIVNRHLRDGDVLLLNRQPTLHKPSIMAHKARVLRGEKTLRLHYANCKAYNADFDGDEMNAHFPQNEVARSEAYNIVGVPYQYLVPKDGTPLSGLIQDHMIAGVRLSMRGRFFNRADYQQLVFAGLGSQSSNTILLPPTILKPVTLWSGKQVLSTIVLNLTPKGKALINMESTSKISSADWQTCEPRAWIAGGSPLPNSNAMTESQVVFRRGELLCGVLDKMHYGATSYGLVHLFYELYGGQYSCRLLTSLARLFTTYLQLHGFTLGVSDILVTKKADSRRRRIIEKARSIGDATAARGVGMEVVEGVPIDMVEVRRRLAEAHLSRNELKRMTIDREYKTETDKITNSVNKSCIPGGLLKKFPDNNLSLMIQSGAKGSSVNAMQISCLLGQIELEGKRPPLMISGRSLPSFLAYDTSPRAGGFIAGRFMTGIRPQEFFFHCMAGREGLIDTAVKTARSGYLQRCLIKHLEGVKVNYDNTVRDSDGCVLQFLYGEDGLDVCKSQYLNEKGLSFLTQNRDCINTNVQSELLSASIAETKNEVKAATKSVRKWIKRGGASNEKRRIGAPLKDSKENPLNRPIEFENLSDEDKVVYRKAREHAPDPVISKFASGWNPGVISEHMQSIVDKYHGIVVQNSPKEKKMSKKDFLKLVSAKFAQAACEPGEPVGILAAQSIGEPSTQMTLNTFHFAGRGEMNVTLGIPRLREILMTGSDKMKTPSMDIPMLKKGEEGLRLAQELKMKLTRVTLSDVLEDIDVTERMLVGSERARIYDLNFKFLPQHCYQDRFCIKPAQILRYFENFFVCSILLPGMRSEMETQSLQSLFVSAKAPRIRNTKAKQEADEEEVKKVEEITAAEPDDSASDVDSDAEVNDDADASAAKRSQRKKSGQEYEDENEEQESGEDDGEQSEKSKDKSKLRKNSEVDDGVETDEDRPASRQETKEREDAVRIRLEEAKDESVEIRKNKVINMDPWIVDYEFDRKNNQNCLLTLKVPLNYKKVDMSTALLRWTAAAVVSQVPKIKRAFVTPPKTKDGDVFIKTDGVNIEAMFKYANVLDLNRLYSNDIHAVSRVYGIEAASRVIVNEVRNVFKVYGITVDPRHLSLVASYMTSGGGYKAFSRHGMLDSTSPFQQISFETAVDGLKNAVLQGKTDYLKSPSARIIVGLPGMEGTGSFDLKMDPKVYCEQMGL